MSIASPNSTGSPSVKCQTPAAGSSKMLPPDVDWSRTLLDPEERWPKSLQAAADLVLSSLQPMIILWGPDLIAVYNNACRPLLGPMHPAAFGQKLRDAWPELWKTAGSALEGAFAGSPAWLRDVELTAREGDRSEHVYADVFASPMRDETGSTAGVLFALSETTSRVLAERRYSERMRQLADAAVAINSTLSIEEMLQRVTEHARQLIGAHQAVISLTINQNWAQSVSAVSLSEKYAEWRSYSEASDGSGIYSLICRHNKPMRLTQAELTSHPAWKGFGKSASKHPPMRGWVAAPLTGRDGGNLGLLQLSDKYEGDFTESDEAIAVQLAQMASVAVENAGLLQETEAARKTAEAERRDAERLNRLKDEFLATVSHELRTPLQAILGWSRLLRGGQADSSRLAKGLEVIDRNAKVQAQLIEDILDVSRIIAGKVRINDATVNIASVVRAAIDTTRPAADAKRIELTAEIDPEIGVIAGDEDRLQQVVWNLLTNAVKFTPSGGRVSVRAARVGTQVEITVADSGAGIAAEFLPHVFERFRQADATTTRAHGGLGLGLAIVRHLVEMHGGTVRAESDGPGRGATFTVTLPVRAVVAAGQAGTSDEAAVRAVSATKEAQALTGMRVLVIDDEADARELLVTVLEQFGAEPRAAGSVAEAMKVLEELRPDVIVSDIGMPGEDGYVLLRKVRALETARGWPSVPAVALTAYARGADRRRALSAGFRMHVTKPVEPAELAEAIARAARCC